MTSHTTGCNCLSKVTILVQDYCELQTPHKVLYVKIIFVGL